MKLIFKYMYRKDWIPKDYIVVCKSFRRENEIPEKINSKDFWDLVLKSNILNELYLANYLITVDLDFAKYVIDRLNDKTIDDCDISSQGWEAYIENDKVIITVIFSTENDERAYINREEVAYAMLKWKSFLEREFDDPNYHEIIDIEDI